MAIYECIQANYKGFEYLKDKMNLLDASQIILFLVYFILRTIYQSPVIPSDYDQNYGWVLANTFFAVTTFAKLASFLRLHEEMSKMVSLLRKVSTDMLPFAVFFLLLVLFFAFLFSI